MDKYEFNIKVEQIKKLVGKSDFQTAMKIADTIDWRRVRNANLLSMIASVYEKNEEYQEAKDILLIAFERAPVGKRLLYKLTQLAIKEGDIQEAESYYREFCELAGDDSRQDVLRYLILKAKGAPLEQLIHSLESYTSTELDEKWLYELAELYHQAGREKECVSTCDKIMLMFGLGQYVDKAMELKLLYAPLTKYQMDLVENRDKYEEKLRMVEEKGVSAVSAQADAYQKPAVSPQAEADKAPLPAPGGQEAYGAIGGYYVPGNDPSAEGYPVYEGVSVPEPVPVQEAYQAPQNGYARPYPAPENDYPRAVPPMAAGAAYRGTGLEEAVPVKNRAEPTPIPVPAPTAETFYSSEQEPPVMPAEQEEMVSGISDSFVPERAQTAGARVTAEEKLVASVREAEVEASLAKEMSRISIDSYAEEPVKARTRVLNNVKELKQADALSGKTKVLDDIRSIQEIRAAREQEAAKEAKAARLPHIMVEARYPEAGLEIAVKALKQIHQILQCRHPVAKISGERLNQKGILDSVPKLAGKDLIVEEAGDLSDAMLEELDRFLEENPGHMVVALVDSARQMNGICKANPSLAEKFCTVSSLEELRTWLGDLDEKRGETARPQEPVKVVPIEKAEPARMVRTRTAEPAAAPRPVYRNPEEDREKAPVRRVKAGEFDQEERPEQKKVRPETAPAPVRREAMEEGDGEPEDEEVMGIDEFAQYCCHYASQIDCNITGKSMLALYERIEIMEEEGVALTKTAAEDLIEDAADRAEKPSIGKRISGLFSSKYDKDGLLILKEEHFI